MRLRKLLAVAALAAIVLTTVPSQAATESANYVAAQGVVVGAPNPLGLVGRYGVGGWTFQGRATAPIRITVKDASGINGGIAVVVCGGPCTSFQKGYCTTSTGNVTLTGVPANVPIRVGVEVVEPGGIWANVGECEGVGTTGTVTVTW